MGREQIQPNKGKQRVNFDVEHLLFRSWYPFWGGGVREKQWKSSHCWGALL